MKRSLILMMSSFLLLTACGQSNTQDVERLEVTSLTAGAGDKVEKGSKVKISYILWQYDKRGVDNKGATLDESKKHRFPMEFVIGSGRMMPGLEEGIRGMKEGEVRRIKVPSHQAYGSKGIEGKIPPGVALVFEVRVIKNFEINFAILKKQKALDFPKAFLFFKFKNLIDLREE